LPNARNFPEKRLDVFTSFENAPCQDHGPLSMRPDRRAATVKQHMRYHKAVDSKTLRE
jgi:hypothetical protein